MIRQDRELLAELAQLNSDVTPFAMRIIDGSATAEDQHEFADRLMALGQRFHERATGTALVIEGDILTTDSHNGHTERRIPRSGEQRQL